MRLAYRVRVGKKAGKRFLTVAVLKECSRVPSEYSFFHAPARIQLRTYLCHQCAILSLSHAFMNQPPAQHATSTQETAYRSPGSRSRELYERAKQVMPGGNTRHSIAMAPYPIYAASGSGCRVTDVEGEERVDFLNNYTSLILGHADPKVTAAVQRQVSLGYRFHHAHRGAMSRSRSCWSRGFLTSIRSASATRAAKR